MEVLLLSSLLLQRYLSWSLTNDGKVTDERWVCHLAELTGKVSAASSCWAPAGCSHRRRQCCLPACRVAGDAATAVQHTSTLPCCWASSLPACQCPQQAPHYTHFDGLNVGSLHFSDLLGAATATRGNHRIRTP